MPAESSHLCASCGADVKLFYPTDESWMDGVCPQCRFDGPEPHRNDLESPSSMSVDQSPTDDAKGPQISDPVNHPAHYKQYPVEVIEITEQLNFLLGNVVKYVLRADYKGKPLEDLKKAEWYLRREITNREKALGESA